MPRTQDPDYRPPREYVPVFRYEADSLGDWKIDRGRDISRNTWGFFVAMCCIPGPGWVIALLWLPVAIIQGHNAKKMIREGEEEGGRGKGWRGFGSESIASNMWERECGPNVRRVNAPFRPPAHLVGEENETL